MFDVTTLKNLLNNFADELFDGELFYYEEHSASSVSYKVQKYLQKSKMAFLEVCF